MPLFSYNRTKHALNDNYWPLSICMGFIILFPMWYNWLPLYSEIIMSVLLTLTIITGVYASTDTKIQLVIGLLLGGFALFTEWYSKSNIDGSTIRYLRLGAFMLFYGYLAFRIFAQLIQTKEVTVRMIVAAIAGFLIIGVFGAMMVDIIIYNDVFAYTGLNSETSTDYSPFYYSFITLTSVGYGDITPNTPAAQALAVLLSIVGQAYFTIVIAIIVGKFLAAAQNKAS